MHFYRLILLLFIAFLKGMSKCEAGILADVLQKNYYSDEDDRAMPNNKSSNRLDIDSKSAVNVDKAIADCLAFSFSKEDTLYSGHAKRNQLWKENEGIFPYLFNFDDIGNHNQEGIHCLYNTQDSTVSYCSKVLDTALHCNDPGWLSCLNFYLAVCCYKVKRYAEAEKYIDVALHYVSRQSDIHMVMLVWQVRAAIKARVGIWDESLRSARSAWQIANSKLGNSDWQLFCIPSFIYYFFETNQSDSVDYYLQVGNRLCSEKPRQYEPWALAGFIQARAFMNYERGHFKEALADLSHLNNGKVSMDRRLLYRIIADCYYHMGQNDKAYVYMDSACQYTDSLARKEMASHIAKFNVKYALQQKNLQIAGLRQEVLEKRIDLFEISFLLICTLLIVAVVIWRQVYKQRLARRKIHQLKQEKELEATRRYIDGLEEECRYFARELHDGIANDLLALQMKADMEGNQEWALAVGHLLRNIRAISHELMPPEFEHLNLDQILRYYVHMLTKNTHVEVTYSGLPVEEGDVYPVPQRIAYELYRVTQEVLMNILKYAEATRISVSMSLDQNSFCCLRITDNGERIPDESANGMTGIGLRTVAHRAKSIQAQVETHYERKNNEFKLFFNLKDAE